MNKQEVPDTLHNIHIDNMLNNLFIEQLCNIPEEEEENKELNESENK